MNKKETNPTSLADLSRETKALIDRSARLIQESRRVIEKSEESRKALAKFFIERNPSS